MKYEVLSALFLFQAQAIQEEAKDLVKEFSCPFLISVNFKLYLKLITY
jgi:hypothetical protein